MPKLTHLLSAAAVIAAATLAASTGQAETGFTFKPVNVTLPDSTRMYTGAGSDAINNNCLACHSMGMVMTQPDMTQAGWQAEVDKMRNVYKAPVAESDVPAIVAYLVSIKGKK